MLPARCDRFVAASDAALEAPCAGAGGFDMVWLSSGKQLRETFHWQIPSAIYDMWSPGDKVIAQLEPLIVLSSH